GGTFVGAARGAIVAHPASDFLDGWEAHDLRARPLPVRPPHPAHPTIPLSYGTLLRWAVEGVCVWRVLGATRPGDKLPACSRLLSATQERFRIARGQVNLIVRNHFETEHSPPGLTYSISF